VSERVFSCRQALGAITEGRVLVSMRTFSPRYDLDRENGIFSRSDHPLRGERIAGRILVSPGVQGGIAGGWAFMMMRGRNVGFAGLVFGKINPVMVQGAAAAGIPLLAGVDPAIFDVLRNRDRVRLEPAAGRIILLEASSPPNGSEFRPF
jgi:predicted aconitase with swiveling domain